MVWHECGYDEAGVRQQQWLEVSGATAGAASVLLTAHCASGLKLRRWAGRFARQSGQRLAVARLPSLIDGYWAESDRRINRLFSTPANLEAVILILDADDFAAALDDPRYAYFRARVEAHEGTVILGFLQKSAASETQARLHARMVDFRHQGADR